MYDLSLMYDCVCGNCDKVHTHSFCPRLGRRRSIIAVRVFDPRKPTHPLS